MFQQLFCAHEWTLIEERGYVFKTRKYLCEKCLKTKEVRL
jgi:hypothetical protein